MKTLAVSPAQRKSVKGLECLICWKPGVDPCHVWDRGRGGCDDPLCVVPLCRRHHRLYDEHHLDILPALLNRGYHAELAHVISAHRVSPTLLLERVTGTRWEPVQ